MNVLPEQACRETVQIVNGEDIWYQAVQDVCDARFGTGYIDRNEYAIWMREPRLLKIALIDRVFAGFAVMLPAKLDDIVRHMAMTEDDVLAIAGDKPMLLYKSAAVRAAYEHHGVMREMAAAGLQTARELGYGSLFGSAWVYRGQIPIAGTFRAFGFTPLYLRHMLWHDDEHYRCVVCKGRCNCDAMIYYKKL